MRNHLITSNTIMLLLFAVFWLTVVGLPYSVIQHDRAYISGMTAARHAVMASLPTQSRQAGEAIARKVERSCFARDGRGPQSNGKGGGFWPTDASKMRVRNNGYTHWMDCYDDELSALKASADRDILNGLLVARGRAPIDRDP